MRWTELTEKMGALSRSRLRNTGDLGELEDALSYWIFGDTIEAAPHIEKHLDLAKQFISNEPYGYLYRGFVVRGYAREDILQNGITVNPGRKEFDSWSTDEDSVHSFMNGFEYYVVLRKPASELDIVIDLAVFSEKAEPFQNMTMQNEIIVRADRTIHYSPKDFIPSWNEG